MKESEHESYICAGERQEQRSCEIQCFVYRFSLIMDFACVMYSGTNM